MRRILDVGGLVSMAHHTIASTRASAKYTPYIATLFFTLPSFLTSSMPREAPEQQPEDDRRQNQTTVARARQPLLEPDDNRSDDQLANTINDSIDRSNQGNIDR